MYMADIFLKDSKLLSRGGEYPNKGKIWSEDGGDDSKAS